jgi:hypothetical protein
MSMLGAFYPTMTYLLRALGLEGWQGFAIALCIFLLTILLVATLGNARLSRNRKTR